MSKSSDEFPQRWPNLGKLGIAILENLVEKTIGQAAIEEVKKPYAQKQIADSLGEALTRVEADFKQFDDQYVREALLQLPVHDLPDAADAIWTFYQRPNDRKFADVLTRKLNGVPGLPPERVGAAVAYYLRLLNREFVNVNAELRDKINALASLEAAETLKAILAVLSTERGGRREESMPVAPPVPAAPVQPGALPPGSYVPFTRNALFTGREADLEQLERSLLGGNTSSTLISQTIQGMGGTGKTQLAVEFAFRCGYRFKGVHWLHLGDLATLDSQIAQCGTLMRLPQWSEKQPEQVQLTLDAWKRDGPRLVILDNFEDPSSGGKVLALLQDPNVRILVTSRRSDWPANLGLHPLSIEVFSDQESVEFLSKYTRTRIAFAQLEMLAQRLGCLPLALELAGRYLEQHPRLSIEDYLQRLERAMDHESMRGFRKEMPDATGHDLDLLTTFSLSWEQVQDEAAQKAFIIAGYCAPNTRIPHAIFERTMRLDQAKCDEVLSLLQEVGLLKGEPAIHPLLADYARCLDYKNRVLSVLARKLATIASERNREADRAGTYTLFAPLLPHVRAVAEGAEAKHIQEAGELWNAVGSYLHPVADYAGAKAAYERALKNDAANFGTNHPKVAIGMSNLGSVLQDLGDLRGARAVFERALQIDEVAFGPNHPDVAIDVNNLGVVLRALGDRLGAKAAFERALKIDEATLGPDDSKEASRVNNLGSVLQELGDLPGARAAYERALKIDEKALGPNHPKVAIGLNNLGSVLREMGDLLGAKAVLERAVQIDEVASNPNHPDVARDVSSLGAVLLALGDRFGAKAAFERALQIDEAAFGPDNPDVASDVNNLGFVLEDLGDRSGARTAYERTLRIYKTFLPEGHPNIKIVERNLRALDGK